MTDTADVAITDPAAIDAALDALRALPGDIATAASDSTTAVEAAAAEPLAAGVATSPALAALSEVVSTLTEDGRETADALAATVAGLAAWRGGVGTIQADGADAVDELGE